MIKEVLLVFIGSGVGGAMRFLVSKVFASFFVSSFPWGTFAVNIIGCFVIGLVNGLFLNGLIHDNQTKLLLTVGFCGGFTTFSSLMNDSYLLSNNGSVLLLIAYVSLSFVLGMLALLGGYALANRL